VSSRKNKKHIRFPWYSRTRSTNSESKCGNNALAVDTNKQKETNIRERRKEGREGWREGGREEGREGGREGERTYLRLIDMGTSLGLSSSFSALSA
jgi:hypothetical protein